MKAKYSMGRPSSVIDLRDRLDVGPPFNIVWIGDKAVRDWSRNHPRCLTGCKWGSTT